MGLYEVVITLLKDFTTYTVFVSAENVVEALIKASINMEDEIYSVTIKQKGPKEIKND